MRERRVAKPDGKPNPRAAIGARVGVFDGAVQDEDLFAAGVIVFGYVRLIDRLWPAPLPP